MSPRNTTGLEALADKDLLKHVWKKRIRSGLRTIRLGDFDLDHDPLECLAFDWELDSVVNDLEVAIRAGDYRAASGGAVRGAKSVGLTRPLASLDPRDLLVYITAIHTFENDLLAKCRPWVRFGRSQSKSNEDDSAADSGWFRLWLKRQGQIWLITSSHEWIVETDVANFFGSLSIDRICEHILDQSRADPSLVGLLRHVLTQLVPLSDYQRSSAGGLPQENFDGSRVIAHTILASFDEEFAAEGQADRYSRWVDDVVIGADTWAEALQCVRRAQIALEQLGLYPNGSKTRIFPRREFEHQMYKDENDLIGVIDEEVRSTGAPKDPAAWSAFVRSHVHERNPRRAWERVLRRIYTLSRALGDSYLQAHVYNHLRSHPGSSAQLLEYLATFRLTRTRVEAATEVLAELGGVYDDIDIRVREYFLLAPNVDSKTFRTHLADWALSSAMATSGERPAVAAVDSLIVTKFGNSSHIDQLVTLFDGLRSDSTLRRQLALILLSLDRKSLDELTATSYSSLPASAQDFRYLRAIGSGDQTAVRMALSLLSPVERQDPLRRIVRPRALVMAPLLWRSRPNDFDKSSTTWLEQLQNNDLRFHDAATIRWIKGSSGDPTA